MDAGTAAGASCRGGLPRPSASALRPARSVATSKRPHPPHRRHPRLPRYGAHPCLSSRSPPTISSATRICMSANRRSGRSPNTARARSANMRCVIGRLRRAGRSSAFTSSIAISASPDPAATARDGFQQLVSEVALGKAGIVMGLEVSRLARNSADWHRLIELCALTATLILDEDGIYDPAGFNDRLLLGLKGTMSEAELHILKARMRGGQLNKARRGELEMGPPVGLVYRTDGTIGLDPDAQVQSAIRMVFETFERTGSAVQTVRFFREQGLQFPRRLRTGPNKGDLLWASPQHARILQVLHNPRYAGAFAYGRTRTRHRPDGGTSVVKVARADWQFVMPGMHQGYIDWERFEANQRRLADNARAFGGERRSGPAREGPALLQGRVLCGLCGERMGVRYSQEHGGTVPTYVCRETAVRRAGKACQTVPGKVVDAAVAALLIEMMTPMTLAVTLEVQRELEARAAETDTARRQHVERMRYEAELARRRYMKVDPDNRLVADTLEAEWNDKLRLHAEAVEEYERRSKQQAATLSAEARQRILDLAEQLPRIWQDPRVDFRERKRIVRLLIDDVTLIKSQKITAHVRLSGGATRTLVLERPLPIAQIRKFKPELVARSIDFSTIIAIVRSPIS